VRGLLSEEEGLLLGRRRNGRGWADLAAEPGTSADALRMKYNRALDRVRRQLGLGGGPHEWAAVPDGSGPRPAGPAGPGRAAPAGPAGPGRAAPRRPGAALAARRACAGRGVPPAGPRAAGRRRRLPRPRLQRVLAPPRAGGDADAGGIRPPLPRFRARTAGTT